MFGLLRSKRTYIAGPSSQAFIYEMLQMFTLTIRAILTKDLKILDCHIDFFSQQPTWKLCVCICILLRFGFWISAKVHLHSNPPS